MSRMLESIPPAPSLTELLAELRDQMVFNRVAAENAHAAKNVAYFERNLIAQLAAALAMELDYPVWIGIDESEPEWPVLFIELPTGQVSWHLPKSELHQGVFVEFGKRRWDGHTTDTKHERIKDFLRLLNA